MKVELKQIVDQLTDALDLRPGFRVCALIDETEIDKIVSWNVAEIDEDGNITPLYEDKFDTIKDLIDEYYNALN